MPDFVNVCAEGDIKPGQMKAFDVGGGQVMVANVEGKLFAIGNTCTHRGGPLAEGELEGFEVTCPWHGAKFDVRSGKVLSPPAPADEPKYDVKVEGGAVWVKG